MPGLPRRLGRLLLDLGGLGGSDLLAAVDPQQELSDTNLDLIFGLERPHDRFGETADHRGIGSGAVRGIAEVWGRSPAPPSELMCDCCVRRVRWATAEQPMSWPGNDWDVHSPARLGEEVQQLGS